MKKNKLITIMNTMIDSLGSIESDYILSGRKKDAKMIRGIYNDGLDIISTLTYLKKVPVTMLPIITLYQDVILSAHFSYMLFLMSKNVENKSIVN